MEVVCIWMHVYTSVKLLLRLFEGKKEREGEKIKNPAAPAKKLFSSSWFSAGRLYMHVNISIDRS
jgi:hypothetical protein